MAKPHLEIMGGDFNIPLWGRCSACQDVTFAATNEPMNSIQQKARLNNLFQQHLLKDHQREDFSQAAARIVKEATKD